MPFFHHDAEEEGFEPPVVSPTSVFKTGALNQLCHSSIFAPFLKSDAKVYFNFQL